MNPRKQFPCMLCEQLYAELEEAETCEREHAAAHDAHCPCDNCRAERCRDTALEVDHD